MKLRMVYTLRSDPIKETLYFTEDFDAPLEELLYHEHWDVIEGRVIEVDNLPTAFPVEVSFISNN